jgi:hypothetical protein
MRYPLPKEGVRYQQVIGQREVQNIFPLLIPTTIPENLRAYANPEKDF